MIAGPIQQLLHQFKWIGRGDPTIDGSDRRGIAPRFTSKYLTRTREAPLEDKESDSKAYKSSIVFAPLSPEKCSHGLQMLHKQTLIGDSIPDEFKRTSRIHMVQDTYQSASTSGYDSAHIESDYES